MDAAIGALERHITRLALECTSIECTPGLTDEQRQDAVAVAVDVHGPIQAAFAGDPDEVGNAVALMALSAAKNLAGCVFEAAVLQGLDPVELLAGVRERLEGQGPVTGGGQRVNVAKRWASRSRSGRSASLAGSTRRASCTAWMPCFSIGPSCSSRTSARTCTT